MKQSARTLLTTALLIGVSGLATAATDGFVVEAAAHPHDDGKTTTHQVWIQQMSDGEHVYELRMEDGVYTVIVDGDKIPDKRIEKKDHAVVILKNDGGVFYEFDLSLTADKISATHGEHKAFFMPDGQAGELLEFVATQDGDNLNVVVESRPRVMLGIYSGEPGESLRQHLGIKGHAILVERVIDGLSADKAGIKDHDIIISIDGSDGISGSELTELLSEHNPGDEIKIVVLRKGEKMKLGTKLFAYNAQALGHDPIVASGVWATDSEDQFPHLATNQSKNSSWNFFSPETQKLTHNKILDGLREAGISEKKIKEIEEQIRASLDENVWSAFGHNNQGGIVEWTDDMNVKRSAKQRYLVENLHSKAQAAIQDAERMTLEFKDGQLVLKRHTEELEKHIQELNERVHETIPVVKEELQNRLGDLEGRLDELESMLDDRMDRLSGLIEHLIGRLEED